MSLYYQDEHVTLFHGDCLAEHQEWLTADVLVTDPPYGIAWSGGWQTYNVKETKKSPKRSIRNDDSTSVRDEALARWGQRPAVAFGSWRQPRPNNTRHRLIWHKAGASPGPANSTFMPNDEEIYVLGDGFMKSSPPQRTVITTTEGRGTQVRDIGHPTPKPINLMETLIGRCPPGVISDPFAGSGSTLIAARNLGRHAIGVELDEKYCEIIAKRLDQQVIDFEALA